MGRRKSKQLAVGAAALGALWLVLGCSLQTTEVTDCVANSDCRGAFGIGSVCASDGFCEAAAIDPRCEQTFPENLLDDPFAADNFIIFGSVELRNVGIFRSFERAAQLAFRQINQAGGIAGREFGAVFCNLESGFDDGLDTTGAALSTARHLVEVIGVPAIIGPATSGDTQSVFLDLADTRAAAGEGVLLISPSATSDALTSLDAAVVSDEAPGLLWRTAPPDSFQGLAIARDMRDPLERAAVIEDAAVIFEEGAYGRGLALAFSDAFVNEGGQVPRRFLAFEDSAQRDAHIASIAADGAVEEVLFISSTISDTVAFFDMAATETGYDGMGIFVPDAAATSDVLGVADGARFPQVRGSRPAPLDKTRDLVYAAFLSAYLTEFSEDAEQFVFTANAYDAGWMAAAGAAWALTQENQLNGVTIARGLRQMSGGASFQVGPTGWNTVVQQFTSGQGVDVEGASGGLDYDPTTEETSAPIEVWEVVGTTLTGIYTVEPE